MNSIWDLISEILTPLLGGLTDHKYMGKKIQWGRIFRMLGVGFIGVGILTFIFSFANTDPSEAIVCAGPFLIIGAAFLVMEIIRRKNVGKVNTGNLEMPRKSNNIWGWLSAIVVGILFLIGLCLTMNLSTIAFLMTMSLLAVFIWLAISARSIFDIIQLRNIHTNRIYMIPTKCRVNLIGRVEGNLINSPISNTPCLFWQIEVKELVTRRVGYGKSSRFSTFWEITDKKSSGDVFYVSDGSGRIYIQPEQAKIAISGHKIYENPEESIYQLLNNFGFNTSNSIGDEKPLQVIESVILHGMELLIRGVSRDEQGLKFLAGSILHPMRITDQSEEQISAALYKKIRNDAVTVFLFAFFLLLLMICSR
jgi:hypothetical protein